MEKRIAAWVIIAATALAVGCQGPEVHIHHELPRAVPLAEDIAQMQAGPFEIRGAGEELSAPMREALQAVLDEASMPARQGRTATVDARAFAEVNEVRGTREIRLGNPAEGALETRTVNTLVRKGEARTVFFIRLADGSDLAAVETRRSYDSSADPRVWGEEGLQRADCPTDVPDTAHIARELLLGCVKDFGDLIQPLVLDVTVRLRGGGGDAFRAGNEAAENGDFNEATSQFRKAVLENPGSADAHFNLAVCLEVQGDVAAAHEQYRKAHELDASDAEAAAGARRTERLLWAMQKTSNP